MTVDGGVTASYTYDAFGRRVSKTTGSGTVDYLYDPLGRLAVVVNPLATPVRTEIYAGSRHLGTYANNTAYFSLTDWLGTERRRVDASGNPVENCNNFAFGDVQTCTQSTVSPMLFTGEEYDAETNLDHFWFRQYSPTQGAWLTPDPAGLAAVDLTNPQSLNRYAYVTNNPLNAIRSTLVAGCGPSLCAELLA